MGGSKERVEAGKTGDVFRKTVWVRMGNLVQEEKAIQSSERIYSLISKISECLLIGQGDVSLRGEFGNWYMRTGFRLCRIIISMPWSASAYLPHADGWLEIV